jgi:hypothetical protein
MRLLRLDDLTTFYTNYTNARPGAGLPVVLVRKFCDPLELPIAVDGELP